MTTPMFADAGPEQIAAVMAAAAAAQRRLRQSSGAERAALLERIADAIEQLGDPLLETAAAETALPLARLTVERARTTGQLRMFAALVRRGDELAPCSEPGDATRQPLAKPDLRRRSWAIGPVVVFGASNFPLAYSVAGGDTASALAAGCPVVVKGHPFHPRTCQSVADAVTAAVRTSRLPQGTFAMVHGASHAVGLALVRDPRTAAVGFTGSQRGGRALFDAAAARPVPIPVYAEMGSVNPVFLLPKALAANPTALAEGLAQSVLLGVGQFCTNPGLAFVVGDAAAETFARHLAQRLAQAAPATMLHGDIAAAYRAGVARLAAIGGVAVAAGPTPTKAHAAAGALLQTDGATFAAHPELGEEVFGPCSVLVRCASLAEMRACAEGLSGQLTATVHATDGESADAAALVAILEEKAGRLVFGGYPTGVEVCAAMQHGGPYPASTDARTTSVGAAAIGRFLRPVCYQSFPARLLPPPWQSPTATTAE